MAEHRMNCRRSGVRAPTTTAGAQDGLTARGVAVEEGLIPDVDELPLPAGFGEEVETSDTNTQVVASYEPPENSIARLGEVSVSIESNGEAAIHTGGTTWGPWTGAVDVTVPLEPAVLLPGYDVRVTGSSTDGNSTTIRTTLSTGEL